jgi:ribosomal protein S18 acetylase RimI-like enzyme
MTQSSQPGVGKRNNLEATCITVRPCAPGDPPLLLRIEQKSFRADLWSEGDFLKYDCLVAVFVAEPLAGDPHTGLVMAASTPEVVVGFLASHEIYAANGEHPGEREILNIAVDPEFRRLGVGSRLLSEELARGGIHFLEVRESNTAARALYERQRFEIVGRRKAYYDHPREPAILMRRSAPNPDCRM